VVRVEAPLENGASLHLLLHFCFLVAAFAFLAVALAFLVVIPEGDLLFTTLAPSNIHPPTCLQPAASLPYL
jgi:hypothetical protein